MYPSSSLCRAQEARQRDRAAGAQLENVRVIAAKASLAWGLEAVAAERREARSNKVRMVARLAKLQKQGNRDARDRLLSENPDRGFGSP
jgi:hypothetical protein